MPAIDIAVASTHELLQAAGVIIREYGHSIADIAACSLEHQNFEAEVSELPGKYAPPLGTILLAHVAGDLAGCIALRPLDGHPEVCEMKRMYVRPAFRGLGVGRVLAQRLIADAKRMKYAIMKLDTDSHPKFAAAIGLYKSLGFVECARYNDDPDPRTLWFEKHLT